MNINYNRKPPICATTYSIVGVFLRFQREQNKTATDDRKVIELRAKATAMPKNIVEAPKTTGNYSTGLSQRDHGHEASVMILK